MKKVAVSYFGSETDGINIIEEESYGQVLAAVIEEYFNCPEKLNSTTELINWLEEYNGEGNNPKIISIIDIETGSILFDCNTNNLNNFFYIRNYHLDCMKEKTGYNHGDLVCGNMFDFAKELFNKGINVMLYNTNGDLPSLFVDKYRFTQR